MRAASGAGRAYISRTISSQNQIASILLALSNLNSAFLCSHDRIRLIYSSNHGGPD